LLPFTVQPVPCPGKPELKQAVSEGKIVGALVFVPFAVQSHEAPFSEQPTSQVDPSAMHWLYVVLSQAGLLQLYLPPIQLAGHVAV
jgi:protein-S-isoprenylcysteine O-methyltransferase Ste14